MEKSDLFDDQAGTPATAVTARPRPAKPKTIKPKPKAKVKMKPPRVIEVPEILELDHVRHEPGHVLAPGLFRCLAKGEYKTQKLDVTYEYGNGNRLEFGGKEPLGGPELRILQALIAMAGPEGLLLTPTPPTDAGQQLRLMLRTEFDAAMANALVVKGSYRRLAKIAGYKETEKSSDIQTIIERLWNVSVIAEVKGKRMGFRLLSEYASDSAEGRLFVALNPMIADAILGGARHCRIELSEVRGLETDAARLIHQRLCGWIDAGKSGQVTLETLISYAWPSPSNDVLLRKRRQRTRASLNEIVAVGWKITEYFKGKFEISRPAHKAGSEA